LQPQRKEGKFLKSLPVVFPEKILKINLVVCLTVSYLCNPKRNEWPNGFEVSGFLKKIPKNKFGGYKMVSYLCNPKQLGSSYINGGT